MTLTAVIIVRVTIFHADIVYELPAEKIGRKTDRKIKADGDKGVAAAGRKEW